MFTNLEQTSDMKKINVAIDGVSSSGKSTMAKALAKAVGYTYIDSGAMYRAVSLYAIRNGWMSDTAINEGELQQHISEIDISFKINDEGLQDTYLNGENVEKQIRTLNVSNGASRVSTLGFVRKELVRLQQNMGKDKGVIMDGRDIGTVVFPDAELKLFVTASPEIRAQRRFDELKAKGIETSTLEDVLANVKERDERDTTRAESPLRKADDAIVLDNSNIGIEEQFQWALSLLKYKINETE